MLALIGPKIATADTIKGIPQDEVWYSLIVARTVPHWCNKADSALVQVGNPSDRRITLQLKTVVGTISPVTAIIPENTTSAVANNHLESPQARIDLAAAFNESFGRSTFNDHQQTQLFDLCTKYRSIFSELGKCTITEAKISLQKHAKPVDHYPYKTSSNPRVQEVIDKCVESMDSEGIIENAQAHGDHPCVLLQKLMDHRVSVSITLRRECVQR